MTGVAGIGEFDYYELIQTTLDSSRDPIVVLSCAHRFVLINDAFCALVRLSREQIIGMDSDELRRTIDIPIDDYIATFLLAGNAQDSLVGESVVTVPRNRPCSEKQQAIETRRLLLRDRSGENNLLFIRSTLVETQITPQTTIDRSTATPSQTLCSQISGGDIEVVKSIFDRCPDLVSVSDGNGQLIYGNAALGSFLGLSTERLSAADSTREPVTQLHRAVAEHTALQSTDNHSRSGTDEIILTGANGEPGYFRVFEQAMDMGRAHDDADHTIRILTDVTEYRSSIERRNREHDELIQRLTFLSALSNFTLKLANKMELIPLLQHIADQLLSLFHADAAFVSLLHESTDYIEMVAASGTISNHLSIHHRPGEGMAGTAWASNEIQVIEDYQAYMTRMSSFSNIRQGLAIPISCNGEFAAVVGITYNSISGNLFSQIDLLNQFAQMVGMAIENARLIGAKNKEISRTEALNRLSQTMFANTELDSILQEITNTVVQVVDAKIVDIYTVDPDQNLISRAYTRSVSISDEDFQSALLQLDRAEDSMLQHCLKKSESVSIKRLSTHPLHDQTMLKIRSQLGLGATMVVPLIHAESVWGVMAVHRDQKQADLDHSDINHINSIANQASITLHRHGLLKTVQHQAHHDSLTTLANRFYFENQLKSKVAQASKTDQNLGVLFLDLDGFKSINDTLGHAVGDKLLVCVSKRLKNSLKENDLLARMGGDEFAFLINTTASGDEAKDIAKRILKKLRQDFVIDGVSLKIGASIGISLFPENGTNAEELLKNADIAMYQAKDNGKNNFQCFSESLAKKYQTRIKTENALKAALDKNEFLLHYQPQVCVKTGKATAVEALIRWNHPQRGLIYPDEFITIAEDSGMIVAIGEWVLNEACRQTALWHKNGLTGLNIAVNISSHQFAVADFVEVVVGALHHNQLDAHYLELEVTESFVMKNIQSVARKLDQLRGSGIDISVDDFGTGYSSLMYLEELPLDKLKIDRSFVSKIKDQAPSKSIANIITLMANTFNLTTIAEGVETHQQLENVTKLGVDYIQGYLYSKPVTAQDLPDVINKINRQADSRYPALKDAS